MSSKRTPAAIVLALVAAVCVPQAAAQQAQKAPAANQKRTRQPPVRQIKIFALKYSDAKSVAGEIQALIGPAARLAVDARTNSLIASGSDDELAIIEAVLVQIDRPTPESGDADGPLTEAIQLRRSATGRSLREVLQLTLDPGQTNFVVDESRNVVIVRGKKNDVQRVKDLLELLERTAAPEVRAVKLRVIWLTTRQQDSDARVPADLAPVVDSLKKIGIDNLALATQLLVNVGEPNEAFSIQGSAADDIIQVEGVRQGDASSPARLQLTIHVERPVTPQPNARGGARSAPVASLQAAVTLAPKQMVVLGASPTRKGNSVFVVQLLEGL